MCAEVGGCGIVRGRPSTPRMNAVFFSTFVRRVLWWSSVKLTMKPRMCRKASWHPSHYLGYAFEKLQLAVDEGDDPWPGAYMPWSTTHGLPPGDGVLGRPLPPLPGVRCPAAAVPGDVTSLPPPCGPYGVPMGVDDRNPRPRLFNPAHIAPGGLLAGWY